MNRIGTFMILIVCSAMALGQISRAATPTVAQAGTTSASSGYPVNIAVNHPESGAAQTTLPNAIYGSAYGNNYVAAQTAEGAALQGMSQVIGAAGQYNRDTAAAAVNMAQAQKYEMSNQVQRVSTFWDVRNVGRMERERERGIRPTPEEYTRRAHAAAPRPMTQREMDPASGVVFWPGALQDPIFETQRIAVDEYAAKWAKYGGLDFGDRTAVRENIHSMYRLLKTQIASIPPQDYVEGRVFLESLLYTTTRSVL